MGKHVAWPVAALLVLLTAAACNGGMDLLGDGPGEVADEGAADRADGSDVPADVPAEGTEGAADVSEEGSADVPPDTDAGVASCAPQEAAGRACEDGCAVHLGAFWDGRTCFDLVGCECVGTDCGAGMASLDACTAEHTGCDGALCAATGGAWFPASAGFCGFTCGLANPIDCLVPFAACDCGPGRMFVPGAGCTADADACNPSFLCRASGGTWHPVEEGHCWFRCGTEWPECDTPEATCDCGLDRDFDRTYGCVAYSAVCPGGERSLGCTSTGGRYRYCYPGESDCCQNYVCGVRVCVDSHSSEGCDCGVPRNFDPVRGCIADGACVLRTEGQSCEGAAEISNCREGFVCCPSGGPSDSGSTCRTPCCPDDPTCMSDGCLVPPP